MTTPASPAQLAYIRDLGRRVKGRPAYRAALTKIIDTSRWEPRHGITSGEAYAVIADLTAILRKQEWAETNAAERERSNTNPDPCGYCGETCGYTPLGNGDYQCARWGKHWGDDYPTGPKFIAHLLGVEPETIEKWRTRGVMPMPSWGVEETGRPQWRRRDILDWAKATHRL